jgi:DNA excision repair protein ERCC-3
MLRKKDHDQSPIASSANPSNPLIIQSDRRLRLEVHKLLFEEARAAISPFADWEKSLEPIYPFHTYRNHPLAL